MRTVNAQVCAHFVSNTVDADQIGKGIEVLRGARSLNGPVHQSEEAVKLGLTMAL